jgi:D-amino-acid dehydrogenase
MKKVIVIGGGILGASTAFHLAKKGAEVTIVDRKDKGQATDAAAGIICPWLSQRRNKAWYALAKAGARYYPSLIEELKKDGETKTGYSKVGAICLHTDQKKLDQMVERALVRRQEAPEIGEITLLNPQETKSLLPLVDEKFASVHVSGGARVDGRELRDSLLRAAQKNGAILIHEHAELLFDKKKVVGVRAGDENLYADTVIVCAGAWAHPLLSPLGVDLKINFQKAQIVHLEHPDEKTDQWPVVMPPGTLYLLAFEENRIVVGSTHEDTEVYDTRITAGGLQELFNKSFETAPCLNKGTFLEARVGFRPFTPGFLPIIGELPGWEGIFVANGLGSSGLTVGPYLGAELANLALGLPLDINLDHYSVEGALGSN